jgi:hypothetical protein
MVPTTFTADEIERTRDFIIKSIHKNSRFVHGKVLGNPYVFYKDIGDLLGYTIESETDGDRLGYPAGAASELEFPVSGLLISAVVISVEYRRPGKGFYNLAQDRGLFTIPKGHKANADGMAELTFWKNHVDAIVQYYGRN